MALDSMDNLRDSMINRGIGNSGLTSQAVGRMNIEELSNLNGELQTSRQTMLNEKQNRDSKLFSQVLKDRSLLRPSASSDPNSPSTGGDGARFVLQLNPGFQDQLRGIPGAPPTGQKFSIVGMNPQGGMANYSFSSVDELVGFLESNPNVKNTLVGVGGDPLEQAFEGNQFYKQIRQIPIQALDKVIPSRGNPSTIIGGRGGRGDEDPIAKQMEYLKTSPERFDITQLPQNERAKIVSGVVGKISRIGSPTSPTRTPEGEQQYKLLRLASKTGRLNEVTQSYVRNGVISNG